MALNRKPRTDPWSSANVLTGVRRDKTISIRIPTELHARLKQLSKQHRMTMSEICIRSMLTGKRVM